jgi:hypothetical protein
MRSTDKSNDLIGIRNHLLPACSIVPGPTTLQRVPIKRTTKELFKLLQFVKEKKLLDSVGIFTDAAREEPA